MGIGIGGAFSYAHYVPREHTITPVDQIAAYFKCSTAESGDFLQWTAFVFSCTGRSQSTMLRSSAITEEDAESQRSASALVRS